MKKRYEYLASLTKEDYCKEIGISVEDYDKLIKEQKEQISNTKESIRMLGESLNNTQLSSKLNTILMDYVIHNNLEILINFFKNK